MPPAQGGGAGALDLPSWATPPRRIPLSVAFASGLQVIHTPRAPGGCFRPRPLSMLPPEALLFKQLFLPFTDSCVASWRFLEKRKCSSQGYFSEKILTARQTPKRKKKEKPPPLKLTLSLSSSLSKQSNESCLCTSPPPSKDS